MRSPSLIGYVDRRVLLREVGNDGVGVLNLLMLAYTFVGNV
jgi:hypothetical protein